MTNDNGTLQELIHVNAMLTDRLRATGSHGYQFGTERNLYEALGYKREVTAQDYINAYRRGSLAGRGVSIHPEYTWKRKAAIIDGDSRSDEQEPASEFLRQWLALADRHQLWQRLRRVDLLGRLGRFAILLLGARDDALLSEPLEGELPGLDGLLYVRPYHETQVTVNRFDEEIDSRRYGLPQLYQVQVSDRGTRLVHHSRVIHVAEELLADDVYGVPALESVYNRLDDLEKVVGGSSEAFWLNIRRGLAILARDGVELPSDTTSKDAFDAEIEKFVHNLSRVMRLSGVDLQDLGADVVSGLDQFQVLVSIIAADMDIPQRLLIGSERGELASSQDERNFAAKIRSRQTDYAEPDILRPLLDWCIRNGVLPPPTSGSYDVEWPAVSEPTEREAAETALTVAQALSTMTGGIAEYAMPVGDFTERYFGYVTETPLETIIEEEATDAADDAGQPDIAA